MPPAVVLSDAAVGSALTDGGRAAVSAAARKAWRQCAPIAGVIVAIFPENLADRLARAGLARAPVSVAGVGQDADAELRHQGGFKRIKKTYNFYFRNIQDAVELTIPKLNEMAYEQVEVALRTLSSVCSQQKHKG